MGLLDIPGPLLGLIDAQLGFLPPLLRLSFWAVFTGVISMLCYWAVSPQGAIAAAKQAALEARRQLNSYDGHEFAEMWPLARRSLATSGRHFMVVLLPALIGSLPALVLIVWVSNHYGYRSPEPGDVLVVSALPATTLDLANAGDNSYRVNYPPAEQPLQIRTSAGEALLELPLAAPVPVVHKEQWWNALIGNHAGYLPVEASVTEVRLSLEAIRFHRVGPDWSQTWELPYFLLLIAASLLIKSLFKID